MQPKYENIKPRTNFTTLGQNISSNATETSLRPYNQIVDPKTGKLNFSKDAIDAITFYKNWKLH